jgi:hypothetical protein
MAAAAGVCPHCQARIDPWRILRMTRRTPYTCASCGGPARIDPRSGMMVVVLYVVALAIPLIALTLLGVSRTVLFVAAVAGALAIPSVFARMCRYEAVNFSGQARR